MFRYDEFKNLSLDQVTIINDLKPLVEQAEKAEKIIKETFLFHIGEDKIEVWSDECNCEYITHDGIWQARYLNQSYDIECNAKTIFEFLKADYLVQNGFVRKGFVMEPDEKNAIHPKAKWL